MIIHIMESEIFKLKFYFTSQCVIGVNYVVCK